MLLNIAEATPGQEAVIEDGFRSTYAELAHRALEVAGALEYRAVAPGDRVAIFAPRGVSAAAAFFGTVIRGAVAVPVNETLRIRQVKHILDHSGTKVLLTTAEQMRRLPRSAETAAQVVDIDSLVSPRSGDLTLRTGSDPALLIYTSGSTGLPKGVTISHGNLWAGALSVVSYLGLCPEDRMASLLPFSFDYGLNQLLCSVYTGGTLVVERSPVPQRVVETLRRHDVSVLAAVPPLWLQLLGTQRFHEPLTALRCLTNTGGRLPADAVRTLRKCQPQARFFSMYGLTEAFRSAYLAPDRVDRKPASVGQAIPGAELLVLNAALQPCGPYEAGELVHRGPTVALGYWNDAEATAARFRPNPLRPPGAPDTERVVFSGDLVYRDDEGDIFFVGRQDNMIKTMGYRVSPDEIIDVLYASGELVEAVVTKEPDELRGERIIAHVVLGPDGDLERLRAFASQELPRYMQPHRFEVRAMLPRTTSGKYDLVGLGAGSIDRF